MVCAEIIVSPAAADSRRDHDRQLFAVLIVDFADGHECGLGVQRVENGLHQEHVEPPAISARIC